MTELADAGTGGLLKRVPGAARPRQEVLAKVQEELAEMRMQLKPALWPIFIPSVSDMYRWRVQLACGCVTDVLTKG
jgi:hypothetical protein